jgi:hypothetical protein
MVANFELQRMPGESATEIYRQHQRRLRQLDGGQPRQLAADDLEAVIWYGNKWLYELLIAQGLARMNPYADCDDSALLREAARLPKSKPCVFAPSTWDDPAPIQVPTP